jgi:perosamine synthetase
MTDLVFAAARGRVLTAEEHPREWPWYPPAAVDLVTALTARGRVFDYGHGPEIAQLESAFAAAHGRRFAVASNSGTSALLQAFHGLDLQPGDEVVVPTFTFLASASPLLLLGAVPVLADAGDAAGNVTADSIAAVLTERTAAIAVTHLFGEPVDLAPIAALARRAGLALIEDCSHAHGARHVDGRSVGTTGDVAIYSVGALKTVSGGMGGMLLTDNEDVHDNAVLLGSFKQRARATIRRPEVRALADVGLGGNLRMTPAAAVLAASHFADLDRIVAVKQRNAARLEAALTAFSGVRAVPTAPGADRGGRYGVHVELDAALDRADVLDRLTARGLLVSAPQTRLLHRSSLFRGVRPPRELFDEAVWRRAFAHRHDDFPQASTLHDSWIALPATRLHGEAESMIEDYTEIWGRAWSEMGLR